MLLMLINYSRPDGDLVFQILFSTGMDTKINLKQCVLPVHVSSLVVQSQEGHR